MSPFPFPFPRAVCGRGDFERDKGIWRISGVVEWGKWEMRPVPGGGKINPNSDARDVRGVWVDGESAIRMLTFWERRVRIDWGVMSFAYAVWVK